MCLVLDLEMPVPDDMRSYSLGSFFSNGTRWIMPDKLPTQSLLFRLSSNQYIQIGQISAIYRLEIFTFWMLHTRCAKMNWNFLWKWNGWTALWKGGDMTLSRVIEAFHQSYWELKIEPPFAAVSLLERFCLFATPMNRLDSSPHALLAWIAGLMVAYLEKEAQFHRIWHLPKNDVNGWGGGVQEQDLTDTLWSKLALH